MMYMEKVAIIGSGNFGSALGHIFAVRPDVLVSLWDSDPAKTSSRVTLAETVTQASVVFICVPSWSLRAATASIAPYITGDTILVSPPKGIDQDSIQTTDEVLIDVLGGKGDVALLHGPMLAAEMIEGLPSFGTIASHSSEVFSKLQSLFVGTTLTLEYSVDLHGVALAGVLKNIYSIGLGMNEAMRLGSH